MQFETDHALTQRCEVQQETLKRKGAMTHKSIHAQAQTHMY
jgi:hypothetical protein